MTDLDLRNIRVDVFRAGIRSDVAVRVTYLPTGIAMEDLKRLLSTDGQL